MQSSKDEILASIRQHTKEQFPQPDLTQLEQQAIAYPDVVAQFGKVLEQGGGKLAQLPPHTTLGAFIATLYPEAQSVANTLPSLQGVEELPGRVFNPDEVEQPAQLNGTDLAIIESRLGVAENGCCWIEEYVRHRAIFFIAEALVIVLRREQLVSNMHQAYAALPAQPQSPFACFISGPSKTADIEQALVFGAHGAKDVTVVLV